MTVARNHLLLYSAAFLRSVGVGMFAVQIALYLFRSGRTTAEIGLVLGAGFAGAAAATAMVSLHADRFGRRRTLAVLALLGAAGAFGIAFAASLPMALAAAFAGMLSAMGRDRGAAFSLEQPLLASTVPPERRTWALSIYNLLLDAGHALGAAAVGVPVVLNRVAGIGLLQGYRICFCGYALLHLSAIVLYWQLDSAVELGAGSRPAQLSRERASPQARGFILRMAGLFGVDAFGGGFLTDALMAFWFFRRFGVQESSLAALFFAAKLLSASSYLGAAWLSRRIGLVNTMVFTHLPSNLLLILAAAVPTAPLAAALYLMREGLNEMDVPARQSYVIAMVREDERTLATGMTNLARNAARAVAAPAAGFIMTSLALWSPLVLGSSFKLFYDLMLFRAFRHVRPPEEQARDAAG